MPRWAKRTDANQAAIIERGRKQGVHIEIINEPCDLLCIYRGRMFTVEVKNPDGRNREQPSQVAWRNTCERTGAYHAVIREGEAWTAILDELVRTYSAGHRPGSSKPASSRRQSARA